MYKLKCLKQYVSSILNSCYDIFFYVFVGQSPKTTTAIAPSNRLRSTSPCTEIRKKKRNGREKQVKSKKLYGKDLDWKIPEMIKIPELEHFLVKK